MRKLSKAAVAAAVIASVGFIATGTGTGIATAQGAVMHRGGCDTDDLNLDVLGEVGVANGLLGNLLNGEGDPGAQETHVGTTCGGH
ncbi:hypothetical protein [Streptomyces roseochromogenus]|uniref:Chaplin domain-containing protein n=1 Tax=Streptomyces roseochromogenus subsp. oscitans DS 12.976 TaxID=1352936 RepID=V6KKF7_STRRC|nr:hypothetical protein [Streptomyces roseochromogenus]EST29464.1 hypothetical protein M878_20520 [Streptomyces roseochromogenus subsp. oscitans DS 12.976]